MIKYFFIGLLIFFSNIILFAQPPFNGLGDGSKNNPYQIWTLDDLMELRDSTKHIFSVWSQNKHFRLMQDINDTLREMVCWFFEGHFYGGGHKINVAMIYNPPLSYDGGFFAQIGSGGSIDSLTLYGYGTDGVVIVGNISSSPNSTVINCTNNVDFHITYYDGGAGIVGFNLGATILNCVNNGSITGVDRIGGIVGENSGTVNNCLNNGRITATSWKANSSFSGVGGIIGTIANYHGGVSNNINIGTIKGQGQVGGIIGSIRDLKSNPVTNNSNFGVVVGEEDTGCIVGRNNGGNISNNHYDKQMCGE